MSEAIFYFDFASPNAYMVHKVLPALEQRRNVQFQQIPVLLGGLFKLTGNKAPFIVHSGSKNKLNYEMLEIKRFLKKHQLTKFAMSKHFPLNTLNLMRMGVAAIHENVAPAYNDAVYTAIWEEGLKMDDPAIAIERLNQAGLSGEKLAELAQTQAIKDELATNTQKAADIGAFGIPTFVVNGELYFGKDRLREVEDALA